MSQFIFKRSKYRYSRSIKRKLGTRKNYYNHFPKSRLNKSYQIVLIAIGILLLISFLWKLAFPGNNKQTKQLTSTKNYSQTPAKQKINLIKHSVSLGLPKLTGPSSHPIFKKTASKLNLPSKSAALIDVDSGYPLYMKNANTPVPIASTTKIMTAIIVLEENNLDQIATVSPKAALTEGSGMGLLGGEKITVRNLLIGLLLNSGNDAAYALAEMQPGASPGDFQKFVDKMNTKAKNLGLKNTQFKDPAGLNDNGRSTAHDLAFLTSYALRNKEFANIVITSKKTVYSTDNLIKHDLKNTNRLINPEESLYLSSALGVKTGYTEAAGHCLVAAAKKDNHMLVGVVLNTFDTTNEESARVNRILLNWGFDSFTWPK